MLSDGSPTQFDSVQSKFNIVRLRVQSAVTVACAEMRRRCLC